MCGDYHSLAGGVGLVHDVPLYAGHPLHGNLHPQVTPGHHYRIYFGENGVYVFDAFAAFQLRHDHGLAACGVEMPPRVMNVLGSADEGNGHPVHLLLHAKEQVGLVLVGEDGLVNRHSGQVDALVR